MTEANAPLLAVRGLEVSFGGIRALQGISFDMPPRSILGVIGPNGAGKTTLFNCLSRLYTPQTGSITLDGKDLLALPVHSIARSGVGRTFQNVAHFASMSVVENVLVGAHGRQPSSMVSQALGLRSARRAAESAHAHAMNLLKLVGLEGFEDRPAAALPFAMQKRMELARALATHPKLILLDEPAAGLNHEEVQALGELIRRLRDEQGVAVLLVEHHMGLVMPLCDQVVVLDFGRMLANGTPMEVRTDPEVIRAYLGDAHAPAAVH